MMWGSRGYAFRGGWGHPGGFFMIWPMLLIGFVFFMLFKFLWPVLLIGFIFMLMRGAFGGGRRWSHEGHQHGWQHPRHGHHGNWGEGWGQQWGKDWGRHPGHVWGWHDGDEKPKRKNDEVDDEKPKRDGDTWYV